MAIYNCNPNLALHKLTFVAFDVSVLISVYLTWLYYECSN